MHDTGQEAVWAVARPFGIHAFDSLSTAGGSMLLEIGVAFQSGAVGWRHPSVSKRRGSGSNMQKTLAPDCRASYGNGEK